MITLTDYHTHTVYSDGKNTPEEIILSAIDKNLLQIGISDHSYTFFDTSYCIKQNKIEEYKKEILNLKQKYKNKINVLLGIEQDYYSTESVQGYDYVIGSVHYVKVENEYIPVDENVNIILDAVKKYFNNNVYDFIELYFKTVSNVIKKTNADIIGHFDLISKFNETTPFFDENDSRYVSAWQQAVLNLLKYNKPFEINTGAIARGYKANPYPSKQIIDFILNNGGKFVLSSDSHSNKNVGFKFLNYINLVK